MATSTAPATSLSVLLIEDDDDDALIVEDLLAESATDVRLRRGRTLPEGLDSLWIASSYLPGRQRALLGGDFYDAVQTEDGLVHVISATCQAVDRTRPRWESPCGSPGGH